jgi:hypothetical protein
MLLKQRLFEVGSQRLPSILWYFWFSLVGVSSAVAGALEVPFIDASPIE